MKLLDHLMKTIEKKMKEASLHFVLLLLNTDSTKQSCQWSNRSELKGREREQKNLSFCWRAAMTD